MTLEYFKACASKAITRSVLIICFKVLLDLARTIFEEQSTLHNIVHKIMMITQSLLQCERCSVLLVDPTSKVRTACKASSLSC